MRFPVIGQGYTGRTVSFESQRSVNLFAELSNDPTSKEVACLVGSPGTKLFGTVGDYLIRGVHEFNGVLYVISGSDLYTMGTDGTLSASIGTLGTSSGQVCMKDNGVKANGVGGNQLIIVDGTFGYIYDIVAGTFTQIVSKEAIQATVELVLTAQSIKHVYVTNAGENFTSPPSVIILDVSSGPGIGASANATVSAGVITDITVVSGGTGYSSGTPPKVTVVDATGVGCVATATVDAGTGAVTGVTISSGGSGYSNFPLVYFYDTTRTPANATALKTNGVITSVTVNDGGTGYSDAAPPLVTIIDPAGTGATATATVVAGVITDVTVTAGGTGHVAPKVYFTDGDGTGATGTVKIGHPIASIKITSGGKKYTPGTGKVPNVIISDPTGYGAVATAQVDFVTHEVSKVTVTNAGFGYTDPTVTFSDPLGKGSGAEAIAHIQGDIDKITVSNAGHGYSTVNPPTVVITDSTGSGAIATATVSSIGTITGVKVVNSGRGYTSPTITFVSDHGSGAVASATLITGQFNLIGVTVTNGGTGYHTPLVLFNGGNGSGATAYATLSEITIQSITVTNGGAGYYSTPTVTISGTGGTTDTLVHTQDGTITAIDIVSGGTGYTTTPTISISAPEGITFPDNPSQVEYMDGYFVVTNGTMSFAVSDLYDGTRYNALATSPVEAQPDNIQVPVNLQQNLFFIKTLSTEVWYDAGTPTTLGSPFSRQSGAVFNYGTPAPWSVAQGNVSIFFLANERTNDGAGFIGVVELKGYTPTVVSPPSITYTISKFSRIDDAIGFCYSMEGHTFYQVTFPTANATFVYDATTTMWHERSTYLADSAYQVNRHLANCYVNFGGKHLVGDYRNGNIYEMSSDYFDDNGDPIVAIRTFQHIYEKKDADFISVSKFSVDVDSGTVTDDSDPQATLSWSNDGGHTFGNEHPASMGKAGQYGKRMIWRRLGIARDKVFRLTMSDKNKRVLISSIVETTA